MKLTAKNKVKEPTKETEFAVKGNSATLSLVTPIRIITLKQLIEVAEIDEKEWEVERYTVNKWEIAGKNDDSTFTVQDLWQVKATLKRNMAGMKLREIGEEIIKTIGDNSPKVKKIEYKKVKDSYLCEIDFFDVHFGKLAWGLESGENYDLKIATKRYEDAIDEMIERIKPYAIDRFLFPIGNDFFNVNSSSGETFAGTPQAEDERWKKTFAEGWRLLSDSINKLSQIAPVDVITVVGNHDYESAFYLGEVLFAFYKNNPNVNVDNSPPVRKYYRYGKNLIGFTHGKDEKINELPLIMAGERSKDFAETKFREWHLGDKHHKKEYHFLGTNEIKGVTVRILRALTSTDQWHYQKGYIGSLKAGEAFVWSKERGMICNLSVNV